MRVGVVALAAAVMALAACSSGKGQTREGRGAGPTGAAGTRGPSASAPPPPLRVVQWGVNDRMLSVVVENMTRTEIRSARAVITARDSSGAIIAAVSGAPGALCCTIIALSPGTRFGLFADFGPGVSRTAKVTVDLSQVAVAPASTDRNEITARAWTLDPHGSVTLVHARLSSAQESGPYVAVQAVLADAVTGHLVAVVSGRFYCLFPGHDLTIAMQLFHPVPPGTVVQRVTAIPIPAGLALVISALPSCVAA
jgi:hypothetical protein